MSKVSPGEFLSRNFMKCCNFLLQNCLSCFHFKKDLAQFPASIISLLNQHLDVVFPYTCLNLICWFGFCSSRLVEDPGLHACILTDSNYYKYTFSPKRIICVSTKEFNPHFFSMVNAQLQKKIILVKDPAEIA